MTENQILSIAYDCNALPEVITDKSLIDFARAIEQVERERCAQIVQKMDKENWFPFQCKFAEACADAIRKGE